MQELRSRLTSKQPSLQSFIKQFLELRYLIRFILKLSDFSLHISLAKASFK